MTRPVPPVRSNPDLSNLVEMGGISRAEYEARRGTTRRERMRAAARDHAATKSANQVQDEHLTANERLALWMTIHVVGVMGCFYVLVAFYGGWMALNVLLGEAAFDPYPFALLLFVSNALQLFWLPVLSVGQNVLARHTEIRAEQDHQRFIAMQAALNRIETATALLANSHHTPQAIAATVAANPHVDHPFDAPQTLSPKTT